MSFSPEESQFSRLEINLENFTNIPINTRIILYFFDSKTLLEKYNIISGQLQKVSSFTYCHYSTGTSISMITIDDIIYDFTDDRVRHNSYFTIIEKTTLENIEIIPAFPSNGTLCVGGECMVNSIYNELIKVSELKKGMKILLHNNTFGTVKCIIKSYSKSICTISKLLITSYHPVMINGVWKFPNDIVDPIKLTNKIEVYSILLEESNNLGIIIEGFPVAPFGHNDKSDPVLSHEFFGNHELVSNALMSLNKDAFENGFIEINGITRNEFTKLINGFY